MAAVGNFMNSVGQCCKGKQSGLYKVGWLSLWVVDPMCRVIVNVLVDCQTRLQPIPRPGPCPGMQASNVMHGWMAFLEPGLHDTLYKLCWKVV